MRVGMAGAAPGSARCVIRHGRVVGLEYSGSRCHTGPAVDPGTVWEAASLSKPVVARYVLRLAGNGLVDLDEALDVDLAGLGAAPDPRWRLVTARRVLTHTSGLPNWRGPSESARAAGVNVPVTSEVLAFERDPGLFGYSGEGFEVLLHALCRRLGVPAARLLGQVLSQAGMRDSSFVWRPGFGAAAAVPHDAGGQALAKHHPVRPRAAGSLHTTLPDYASFCVAVLAEGADEIFTPGVLLDEERGRSLGWATVRTAAGQIAWQHGDNRGFKHIAGLRRDRGDGIVMFTNGEDGSACRRFFSQVLGASPW